MKEGIQQITPEMVRRIPSPFIDPVAEAKASYSIYYQLNKDDSPRESRSSLAKRLHPVFASLKPGDRVLDVGAGRGIFELEYGDQLLSNNTKTEYTDNPITIITLDIASLTEEQLFTTIHPAIYHVQASGTEMPFPDDTFASACSNLAIDFMPKETLPELRRVVQEGAAISVNLHHPDTITPGNIEQELHRLQRKLNQQAKYHKSQSIKDQMALVALKHKLYLKDNQILFTSTEQIEETFTKAGFTIEDIRLGQSFYDKWWEVDMKNGKKRPSVHAMSLSRRLKRSIPDLQRNDTIATCNMSSTDTNRIGEYHASIIHENNLIFTSDPEENAASAVLSVIKEEELDDKLPQVMNLAKHEASIHLDIKTKPNSGESMYYYPELDEKLDRQQDLYVRSTIRKTDGVNTWWEVDGLKYPNQPISKGINRGKPGIYRTGPSMEYYTTELDSEM